MKAGYILFFLLLGSAPVVAEQICDANEYPLSLLVEQYVDHGDATLTDTRSKMTWMRCSLGQAWNGTTCTGSPAVYTWTDAHDALVELNKNGGFAGHSDWRIPHIPELARITERQCTNPRTNLELFPETPADFYWTETTPADPGYAYALSFGSEGAMFKDRKEAHHVRLVRGPCSFCQRK